MDRESDSMTSSQWQERCTSYLNARTGTYDFRCQRYDSVINVMLDLGFAPDDLVVDLGAGQCEFNHRMHERGLKARYLPIDGAIDGTDLESWVPPQALAGDFFVLIEILNICMAGMTCLE